MTDAQLFEAVVDCFGHVSKVWAVVDDDHPRLPAKAAMPAGGDACQLCLATMSYDVESLLSPMKQRQRKP
jgi:hypothetical protein